LLEAALTEVLIELDNGLYPGILAGGPCQEPADTIYSRDDSHPDQLAYPIIFVLLLSLGIGCVPIGIRKRCGQILGEVEGGIQLIRAIQTNSHIPSSLSEDLNYYLKSNELDAALDFSKDLDRVPQRGFPFFRKNFLAGDIRCLALARLGHQEWYGGRNQSCQMSNYVGANQGSFRINLRI
jgi:hypothetical protein